MRDSAGVSIAENELRSASPGTWHVVAPLPETIIGGPRTNGDAAIGRVMGARRLPEGDIVIADFDHRRVSFFNAGGTYRFGVDVVGVSGQREPPWGLFAIGSAAVAEWDGVANRMMVLTRKGQVTRTLRVDNPPDVRESAGWSRPELSLDGSFASGDLLGRVENPENPPGTRTRTDSFVVYHVAATGRITSLGAFFRSERFRFDGRYVTSGQLPLGRNGSIAVDDASWLYTDGSTFEIERRAPSGRLLAVIRIDRTRQPVTPQLIQRLKRAQLERSDPVLRRDDSLALEWMPFPARQPAYTALLVDDAHNIWARIWAVEGDPATWDVFSASGRFLGTVSVPPDLDVLQVGDDHLLARYTYRPDDSEVRVYRLDRPTRPESPSLP